MWIFEVPSAVTNPENNLSNSSSDENTRTIQYSTQKNIVSKRPDITPSHSVGKYLNYPDKTAKRAYEGGMRLKGRYKSEFEGKPLVTVVTTVYNRESVVEKAICSVLTQTYDNIEYIVVDGASSDNTTEVIRKYEDVIDYFVSEPDGGLYEGMNKGLELAQGSFIIILNSDDWYIPSCIQTLVDAALADNRELVCALANEVDASGAFLRAIPMLPFGDNVRMRMPLRHETMLVSKNLYNRVGLYDETYQIIADLKLTQKIYDEVRGFHQLNAYVMYFRKMGVAVKLNDAFISERKRLLSEQFPFLEIKEIELLANEYTKNITPFVRLAQKYKTHDKLVRALKGFLSINGALGDPGNSEYLHYFI